MTAAFLPDQPKVDHAIAYPIEARLAHMRRIVSLAAKGGYISLLRPGYIAGTFGVTKAEVKDEIKKHNELAGDGK